MLYQPRHLSTVFCYLYGLISLVPNSLFIPDSTFIKSTCEVKVLSKKKSQLCIFVKKKIVMAQATIDLRSTRWLVIKLYGKNRQLKKELKGLRLRTARINLLNDDDVLEIEVNENEREEIAVEKSPPPQPSAPQVTKRVRFNEKVTIHTMPSRLQWCENCLEKTNYTRKDCALPRLYCKICRHYGHKPRHCRSNVIKKLQS